MTETEQYGDLDILVETLGKIYDAVSDPKLAELYPSLAKSWVNELLDEIPNQINRDRRRGRKSALVVQFADGILHYQPEARFIKNYFERFGTYITDVEDNRHETNGDNINDILLTQKLPTHKLSGISLDLDSLPSGSALVVDSEG